MARSSSSAGVLAVSALAGPQADDDAERFHQATLDSLTAHVTVLDEDGTIVAVNAAWTVFEDAREDDAGRGVGADYFEAVEQPGDQDPSGAPAVEAALREVLAGVRDDLVVEYPRSSGGEKRWFVLRATRFVGHGATRVVVQHQDVTPRREAERAAGFRSQLLDAVDAAVIALDPAGLVTVWSRGAEELYGYSSAEAVGRAAHSLLLAESDAAWAAEIREQIRATGRWEGDVLLRRKDGSRFPGHIRNATITDPAGQVLGFVGVSVDQTERLRAEGDLRSARDYMRAIADSMGDGLVTLDERGAVVYLNPRAEELLGWTVDELSGREFHEALHDSRPDATPSDADDCPLAQARRSGHAVHVEDDTLVRRDGTLLPVQQTFTPFETEDGVGGFVLVFHDISERKRREHEADRKLHDLAWLERIRDALDRDRLVLYAQPVVDVDGGRVVKHELLVRMIEDDGSVVPPGAFLPVAEHYGLVGELDRWVIREGLRIAAGGLAVGINVSAYSLSDSTLFDYVDAELRRSGAAPSSVTFELTETALLRDEEAALRFVAAIRLRGCKLALDDFGTGYGGFSYLKRLPVDYLKIDIEFVRDLVAEPASRQVVEAVVSLARGFAIKTIAEGVEDEATLTLLRTLGVDYAQGFHLGRPAPFEDTGNEEETAA